MNHPAQGDISRIPENRGISGPQKGLTSSKFLHPHCMKLFTLWTFPVYEFWISPFTSGTWCVGFTEMSSDIWYYSARTTQWPVTASNFWEFNSRRRKNIRYRPGGVAKTCAQLETVGRGAGPWDTDYQPTARLSCIGNEILLFSCAW